MGAISSINFKKSNAIQTMHNDRELPPNYLIGGSCECNKSSIQALKLKEKIIQAKTKNKSTLSTFLHSSIKRYNIFLFPYE